MNYLQIASEYRTLWDMLEESQGEVTPGIEAYMDEIGCRAVSAVFNLQDLREQAEMSIKACKERASEYTEKAKRMERAADNLKRVQIALLQASGQKSMENGVHKITLTQNPVKVNVVDEDAVPASFKIAEVKLSLSDWDKVKYEVSETSFKVGIDKKSISEAYKKAKVELPGVEYVQEPNVRVS